MLRRQYYVGGHYLRQSGRGEKISRYHIEASITAEHCLAQSFQQTRWDRIASSYELLEALSTSPVTSLNKVIAVAECRGPEEALAVFKAMESPSWLERSYHWYAVKADLLFRCEMPQAASEAAKAALELAPTPHINQLLLKRIQKYLTKGEG